MISFDQAEAAGRIGVDVADLAGYVELGIVRPDADGRFSPSHLRRAGLVKTLVDSGIPLDGLATAIRTGQSALSARSS